jgi:peptidoglycan-N-acetylglucosamine deacetylase
MSTLAPWLAGSGIGAASGLFAWAATAPSAQLFGKTLHHTGKSSTLALTFDDGPNPALTPQLLDLLDSHHAHATFFLVGKHVRAFPQLAEQIAQRGHAIGNHTDSHPSLTFLSPRKIQEELSGCDAAIEQAIGRRPQWMRPPYGFRGPHLASIVRSRGARIVMWSKSGRDWNPQPAEQMIRRLERVGGGDVVLLHDADHKLLESDRRHTFEALKHWLPRWRDAGLQFVGVDEI